MGVMLARSDCLVCAQSAHASGYLQGAGVRQRVPGGVDGIQGCKILQSGQAADLIVLHAKRLKLCQSSQGRQITDLVIANIQVPQLRQTSQRG